eukprot:gene11616-2114_t
MARPAIMLAAVGAISVAVLLVSAFYTSILYKVSPSGAVALLTGNTSIMTAPQAQSQTPSDPGEVDPVRQSPRSHSPIGRSTGALAVPVSMATATATLPTVLGATAPLPRTVLTYPTAHKAATEASSSMPGDNEASGQSWEKIEDHVYRIHGACLSKGWVYMPAPPAHHFTYQWEYGTNTFKVRTLDRAHGHPAGIGFVNASEPLALVVPVSKLSNLWHSLHSLIPASALVRRLGLGGGAWVLVIKVVEHKRKDVMFELARNGTFLPLWQALGPSEIVYLDGPAVAPDLPRCFRTVLLGPLSLVTAREGRPNHVTPGEVRDFAGLTAQHLGASLRRLPAWTGGAPGGTGRQMLLVNRHAKISRTLLNAHKTALAAEEAGFNVSVVYMEDYTIAQQIKAVADADVLVAMHGMALCWLLWLAPGARVVELFPRDNVIEGINVNQYNNFGALADWANVTHLLSNTGKLVDTQ